jgi:hypothetical protein
MLPLPNSIFAYFDVCQPDAVPGGTSDQVSIVNQGMFMMPPSPQAIPSG